MTVTTTVLVMILGITIKIPPFTTATTHSDCVSCVDDVDDGVVVVAMQV